MPDWEKVEKVINGLEDSLANNGCGFMDGVGELFAVSGEDLQNAIALLKAQEPRVMTAEQLEDWLEPVYLEDIFSGARWALIADFSANWFTFKVTEPGFLKEEEFHATEYGRRWRCWTSRPTDAQREAVKWE